MVSGPNEAQILYVSSQKEFSEKQSEVRNVHIQVQREAHSTEDRGQSQTVSEMWHG